MERVKIAFRILDVGCGYGGTTKKMANIASKGRVYGIVYSPDSVKVARKINRKLVNAGSGNRQSVSIFLPFQDNTLNLVTTIEPHCYWSNLIDYMEEMSRVLKPETTFLVVRGEYEGSKNDDGDGNGAENRHEIA